MDNSALFTFFLIVAAIVGLFVLITVIKTMYTVRTYTAGIVERFGKYNRIARPGLQFLVPWCETVRFIDLQVRQAAVNVETKTKDNVFVTIPVSVQFQVVEERSFGRRALQVTVNLLQSPLAAIGQDFQNVPLSFGQVVTNSRR